MHCPHCASTATKEQTNKTSLDYRMFRYSACKRAFNECTGFRFNFLEYPTDIVLLVVLWRLRYTLSLRDLAKMFLELGFGSVASASYFCRAFNEVRQFYRVRTTRKQHVVLLPVFAVLTHPGDDHPVIGECISPSFQKEIIHEQ